MANGEIKQKITLEGEQQYKQALKDAQRNLRTLRSELKAETAELGKNASEQAKAEAKTKSLQKQIKEQEQVVKTLRAALAEVKEKYGDNEDAVAKWEQKLNDARTTLANMKNDLEGVGDSFKGIESDADMATVATKSVADSLGSLASIGESISSSIESVFTGLIGTVKEVIGEVWAQVTDLAARSNGLVDLAGYWGTEVTTIQKYKGAVAEASGSLEDLNSIVTKINSKDAKTITELTGVSKENYKDQWQYAMAVMDAMSQMTTEARNAAGFELFGKGATKAFDLLNDWQTVLDHLDKYDAENGGYGLTGEQLQSMSDLYDKINGMKESWSQLKDMVTAGLFGQLSIDLVGNAQGILDSLLAYFNAESDQERDAALQTIEDNILAMFEKAKEAINKGIKLLNSLAEDLQASDNPTVKALGDVLSGLKDALEWLANEDNWGTIETALGGLIALWAAGKVGTAIANIASFASHLKTIGLFGGTSAAAAAAGGEAAGTSWGTAFASAVVKAAPWLTFLYTLLKPSGTATDEYDSLWDENGNLTTAGKEAMEANNGNLLATEGESTFELKFSQDAAEELADVIEDVLLEDEYTKQDKENAIQDWWDAWREGADDESSALDWMQEVLGEDFGAVWDTIIAKLDELGDEQTTLEDIPAEWWSNVSGGNSGGLTSDDVSGFRSLPGLMQSAVQRGAASGVGGIKVTLDGAAVGRLVAPYVSTYIASDIG